MREVVEKTVAGTLTRHLLHSVRIGLSEFNKFGCYRRTTGQVMDGNCEPLKTTTRENVVRKD